MRTTTIYNACEAAEHIWNPHGIDHGDVYSNQRVERAERQCRKFYAELLFRMGQRDQLVAEKEARAARDARLRARGSKDENPKGIFTPETRERITKFVKGIHRNAGVR